MGKLKKGKAPSRDEVNNAIDKFLAEGGEIKKLPNSFWEANDVSDILDNDQGSDAPTLNSFIEERLSHE